MKMRKALMVLILAGVAIFIAGLGPPNSTSLAPDEGNARMPTIPEKIWIADNAVKGTMALVPAEEIQTMDRFVFYGNRSEKFLANTAPTLSGFIANQNAKCSALTDNHLVAIVDHRRLVSYNLRL